MRPPPARPHHSYDCTNGVSPISEVGIYANPSRNMLWAGLSTPAGDANSGHCARKIMENAAGIAAYRTTRTPTAPTSSTIKVAAVPGKCVDAPTWDDGRQVRAAGRASCRPRGQVAAMGGMGSRARLAQRRRDVGACTAGAAACRRCPYASSPF
jgi:hypothetical protein